MPFTCWPAEGPHAFRKATHKVWRTASPARQTSHAVGTVDGAVGKPARRDAPAQPRPGVPASTANATDAIRDCSESAREVSTTGTVAPSTRPAQSPPPM